MGGLKKYLYFCLIFIFVLQPSAFNLSKTNVAHYSNAKIISIKIKDSSTKNKIVLNKIKHLERQKELESKSKFLHYHVYINNFKIYFLKFNSAFKNLLLQNSLKPQIKFRMQTARMLIEECGYLSITL